MSAAERVHELRRGRPRSRFLRGSVWALGGLVGYSWLSGEIAVGDLFSERRRQNLVRFLEEDAAPYALRGADAFEWSELFDWMGGILSVHGADATWVTLWLAGLAMALAGIGASLLSPLATRTLMHEEPYLGHDGRGLAWSWRRMPWRLLTGGVRALCVVMRAIPEYVLAFLLLGLLGPGDAWPAVLALAIHNAGILGRLGADSAENLDRGPLRSLRMLGASRRAVGWGGVYPQALPRFLLYFFYRFETCIREATVLGMLGVVSLGYWIAESRAHMLYDEMIFLVMLGALLVLATDIVSMILRSWLRRAA